MPPPELEAQRRSLLETFTYGWVTPARGPLYLSDEQLARVERVRSGTGGGLSLAESDYLRQLEAGGRLGEPLPAAPRIRRPYITGMGEDFEVLIRGTGDEARVIIVFSHERWPGLRFGHEFPPPEEAEDWEPVLLMEEVETGGLARLMKEGPAADDDGVIWMHWR